MTTSILRQARPYLRLSHPPSARNPHLVGRLVGAGLLAAATELAGLALMATATWLLVTAAGQPPLVTLSVAIVAVRALAIGRGALRYTERLAGHDAVLRMLTEVRARVFAARAASRAPSPDRHSGDSLSQLVSDVDAVQDLMLRVVVPTAAAMAVGALAITGAALVVPLAGLVLAGGLLLAGAALPALAVRVTRHTADRVAPLRAALAAETVDLTHGAADLAAFGATRVAVDRAAGRAGALAAAERRLALLGGAVDAAGAAVSGLTAAAVVAVAIAAGVDGALVGVLGVGTLAAVESALALVAAARRWAEIRGSLDRLSASLAVQTPPAEPEHRDVTGHLALHGVCVRYREGAPPALSDVELEVPPGARVAVVGPSGAGKSTLVGVLAGAVAPDAGSALLDGRPIAGYGPPPPVTGLLAEAHVFHATVRDNLLLGRPDADEHDLAAACAVAGLLDWVREQPDGWDTVVGEDGGQLSGGQRQRLALARALLAAPPVLVLDEPTEGLDPAAAAAVLDSVLAATAGRSLILVTHRLHGLAAFDEILVLDGGRVVQRGRHEELAAAPGWYRDQWQAQEIAERGYLSLTP
ncbi:MAG: thiol reductant ABC exporter subunit CydC [Micromonosporaceae bacterium]|jgi:ATP-binding cassette subfamily C protein CydC|nr:thiol reductant ABC exporter subunit CydC [Micromonosporaceae bacterium]